MHDTTGTQGKKMTTPTTRFIQWGLLGMITLAISACGGADPSESSASDASQRLSLLADSEATSATPGTEAGSSSQSHSFLQTTGVAPSAAPISLQQDGARLNSEELAQIAQTGVLPKAFAGKSLSGAKDAQSFSGGATKSAASRVPTYRFFNTRTSAHFFTTSEAERANVQATLPFMSFEGPAFHASSTAIPGLSPVHRFYNTQTGVHFYTISEAERALVAATLPQFSYEGVAYHASTLPGTGYTPLYRFFYASKGFHFYSNSAAEKDNIIATLPQYSYEGIGYYVLGDDWQTPAVPHTGITSSQCYRAGIDVLTTCTPSPAQQLIGGTSLNLNPQQDGHRRNINPMSYSAVASYPLTSCVRDDVTGLIWEGKTPTGERATTNLYTNYGDGTTGDTSAYVARLNQLNLCGFSDWRLPTVNEFQGLGHYGEDGVLKINVTAFPNTSNTPYWTSEVPPDQVAFWYQFNFGALSVQLASPVVTAPVRLVRGVPWSGPRHIITSAGYAGDGANNAVLDRKTGLTWRRCLEGQVWNGDACLGASGGYTHEEALVRANSQSGWRAPNIRELGSLIDPTRVAPTLDPVSFPGSSNAVAWSSTPFVPFGVSARVVSFFNGSEVYFPRNDDTVALRLVRINP